MTQVLALVGSLRSASINRQLAETAQAVAPAGTTIDIFGALGELPFYNEDVDGSPAVATGPVAELRAAIVAADAVLLVTPEYNGTLPAVLKNAIDWASRPYGQGSIAGKPVAVISASMSPYAGVQALGDAQKAVKIAGGVVVEEAALSIGEIGKKFAGLHPRDDAGAAGLVGTVIRHLVATAKGELVSA
jgi:NAD(P)H-dependent FMN reductase